MSGQNGVSRSRLAVGDAVAVFGWFTAAGLLGALLWWQITPLAEFTRVADNGEMGEGQLARQVSADAWFGVIAFAGGLISGLVLTVWRKRDVAFTVLLIALGGVWASAVMVFAGRDLGPGDPGAALAAAAIGEKVPLQLEFQAPGLWVVWSASALLAALGVLWSSEGGRRVADTPAPADTSDLSAHVWERER